MGALRLECKQCGLVYSPLENIGSWQCGEMFVYNEARGKRERVPADHDGPYSPKDNFTAPSYVKRCLVGYKNEAIVSVVSASAPAYSRTAAVVYENVTFSRVCPKAYARTQQHIYVPPRPVALFDSLTARGGWF